MSAADWIKYLWDLLPRPYKVYEAHRGDEAKTEIRKYVETLSSEYDKAQEDIIRVRDNWFPQLMDARLLDLKGRERGRMTRWAGESDDEFRLRVSNAFDWFALGGTASGMKHILELLGYRNVRITERITEDRWAEFGVDVALPSGELLVTENIERIKRIVNEIKAAHTRLVSTNVEYDPPDIDLDPDHMHRYDYCYYDLGFWPRPNVHWIFSEQPLTERVRMMLGRERFYRMMITSAPTYDVSIYDGARPPLTKLYRARRFMFVTEAFRRGRRWSDGGTWDGGTWDGGTWDGAWSEIKIHAPRNWAKIVRYVFSEAVYDGGEPMDTLNAVYAPAQTKVYDTQGAFDDERYDGDRIPPHDEPILRFKTRYMSFGATKLPEARPSATAFHVKHSLRSAENTISWSSERVAKYAEHLASGVIELADTKWPCSRSQVVNFEPTRLPNVTPSATTFDCKHLMQISDDAARTTTGGVCAEHYANGDAVLRARWQGTWQDKNWNDADVRFNNANIKESV